MTLEVGLLGAPHVTRDGVGLAFDTRKAVALLAYLGERDRPVLRETLIAALWPEAERERGGAALRRTLSTIRSVTGAGTLVTAGAAVALAGDVTVDVRRMRALIGATRSHAHSPADVCADCRELLTEAVALHRGRFLEGFVLRDSVEFEEWTFASADQLHREVADALARLVDACVLTGDLAAAVEAGNRRVALEPLSEPAHRSLMRVHGWHGRREEAIRQYRVCVRVLDAELGVAPLAETTRLYEEIVAGRLAPSSQTAGLTAPAAPAASPAPRSPSEPAPSRAAPVAVSSGDRPPTAPPPPGDCSTPSPRRWPPPSPVRSPASWCSRTRSGWTSPRSTCSGTSRVACAAGPSAWCSRGGRSRPDPARVSDVSSRTRRAMPP